MHDILVVLVHSIVTVVRLIKPAVLRACVAESASRRHRRDQRIAYVDPADLERLAGPVYLELDRKLDDAKRVAVLRACMDEHGCAMFDLRVLGLGWEYIAKL